MASSIISMNIEESVEHDEICTEQAYREAAHRAYINAALDESMLEANDPNTKWLSQSEMKARLAKRRESRIHV